jgi:SAM-dependent methyltransferase
MTDVLHHVPDVGAFLGEAVRVLRPGGVVLMVEPWNTPFARVVWRRLHHEPFAPEAADWRFEPSGPLSGANTALPWMVFARDRARFEREFPQLDLVLVEPFMPFRYLVSGGISMRSLQPAWATVPWRFVEWMLSPAAPLLAMFARIELRRRPD